LGRGAKGGKVEVLHWLLKLKREFGQRDTKKGGGEATNPGSKKKGEKKREEKRKAAKGRRF